MFPHPIRKNSANLGQDVALDLRRAGRSQCSTLGVPTWLRFGGHVHPVDLSP